MVIAEPESRVFADPFFAQQLRGISRELAEHDYQLLLMMLERSRDYDRIGRYLSGGHVDGALMFSLHGYDPPPGFAEGTGTTGLHLPSPADSTGVGAADGLGAGRGAELAGKTAESVHPGGTQAPGAGHGTAPAVFAGEGPTPGLTGRVRPSATVFGLPAVFGGRPGWPGAEEDPELLYVDSDNRDGARQAVSHLLERGRRRIAVITGPLDQTSALDRLHGYLDALDLGPGGEDPALTADGRFTVEGGERAMAELLDRSPDLDAVFAGNDLMASGALRTLRAYGRGVPSDVAVVGYDDSEHASWAEPALTTVRQDVEGMGRMMAELLLRRLDVVTGPERHLETGTGTGAGRAPGARELGPVVTTARLIVRDSS